MRKIIWLCLFLGPGNGESLSARLGQGTKINKQVLAKKKLLNTHEELHGVIELTGGGHIKHPVGSYSFLIYPIHSPLKPWGGALYAPSLSFCLLLKIIMRHPYLKILDLAKLFVADALMRKES